MEEIEKIKTIKEEDNQLVEKFAQWFTSRCWGRNPSPK